MVLVNEGLQFYLSSAQINISKTTQLSNLYSVVGAKMNVSRLLWID